jgi:hypothetical protein
MSLPGKKLPTIYAEERALIPLVRYQMYYNYAETKILQQIPVEQQNIENHNTKNDTFIDRNPSSLASSRGKPPTEQSSITIILKTNLSHAFYSYLY